VASCGARQVRPSDVLAHALRVAQAVGGQGDDQPARILEVIAPSGVASTLRVLKVHGAVVLDDQTGFGPRQIHPSQPAVLLPDVQVALRPWHPRQHEIDAHQRLRSGFGAAVQQGQSTSRGHHAATSASPANEFVELGPGRQAVMEDVVAHRDHMGEGNAGGAVEPGSPRGGDHGAVEGRQVLGWQSQSATAHARAIGPRLPSRSSDADRVLGGQSEPRRQGQSEEPGGRQVGQDGVWTRSHGRGSAQRVLVRPAVDAYAS
jgi:hypothetical protein